MSIYKIPKTIHYIWLGTKPLDKVSIKCMQTWEKYLPDYQIIRWSDKECLPIIEKNRYAKQAYDEKKYAFVSDYLRVYILYHYGGVYMDTDVQIFKPLDNFLIENDAFSCFENAEQIPTALMASAKGNEWMHELLCDYDKRLFIDDEGNMDQTTNVITITELSKRFGFVSNGKEQIFGPGVHMYTKDYFCPIDTSSKKNDVFTENTYAAHLYNGSWRSPFRQKLSKIKKWLGIDIDKVFGEKFSNILRKI